MTFFHGITIQESIAGGVNIQSIQAAVIGLVGSAPTWAVSSTSSAQPPLPNTLFNVNSSAAQSAEGPLIQGYSIPYALNQILAQAGSKGVGQVICVNVFDPTVHQTPVAATAFSFPASGLQFIALGHMGVIGPGLNANSHNGSPLTTTVVVTGSSGTPTFVENTDYTVDYVNGIVFAKTGGSITTGETVKVAFSFADPSLVTDEELIGGVTNNIYTGMQLFKLAFQTFGFSTRILIAPGYNGFVGSKDQTVATALQTMANTLPAICVVDSPAQETVTTALSSRSNSGAAFDTSDERAALVFPNLTFTDTGISPTGTTVNVYGTTTTTPVNATVDGPYSAWFAGVWSSVIVNKGFWFSPSNNQITGPTGPDTSIYMSATDPASDTNNLNAAGIVTVFNSFGTGLRVWGNRSAAFPTESDPTVFLAIRMALDVVELSVQQASLQFLDGPITTGFINSVLGAVNGFLGALIQQGALLPGSKVSYNPTDNPAVQLGAGIIVFEVNLMPPPPAENIIYNFTVNTALLANISPQSTTSTNVATQ
jgi:phage tail sheath protein FI